LNKVNEPTEEQMKNALHMHCFITEKRDGRIKARAVANGPDTLKRRHTHLQYV